MTTNASPEAGPDKASDFRPADWGRVALLLGGQAAEREISLRSGAAVLAALQRLGVEVEPIDPDGRLLETLRSGGFARAFIILHGRGGEDGQVQGALETIGLPYTGSGVLGSAIGMDKYRTKLVWAGAGLPTAPFALLHGEADLDAASALGFPLMVKPVHEGSSLGMAKVEDRAGLAAARAAASAFDGSVIAEAWLPGAEFTCAILDGEALPLIRLETPNTFYDFEAKYQANTTSYICPCGLPAEQEARFQALCRRAFETVGASGWGRVDFMLDAAGEPVLLEINTVPGMTDHSLVPMAARVAGMDFDRLVARILMTSGRARAGNGGHG